MSKTKGLYLPLLLVFALAAGLRFYRLDAQSFWNDEGNSARIAERTIPLILEGAAGDIHPPLYYLALHYWRALAGQSEFALRALSSVGGLGLVALIYVLGADAFGPWSGLAAALMAAINPFQVYYSQEARSYIWVAFLGAAAAYAALRWLENPHRGGGLAAAGYVLGATAGLYTHYLFPITLIPINLIVLTLLLRRKALPRLGGWLGLHLIIAVLYLPWAPTALHQLSGWPSSAGGASLESAGLDLLRLFSLGVTIKTADSAIALLGFGFLSLLGLIPPRAGGRRAEGVGLALVVLWLVIPVAAILVLGLYKEALLKFLVVASPAFCLLIGRGLYQALAPRSAGGVGVRSVILLPAALSVGLILSFSYESLDNLYFDPAYARADYREMARTIQAVARPGDGIILNAANQWEVFTYYYPEVERVYPLPRSRPVREAEVVAELENITTSHDRLFAIFWAEAESDPERLVERWLDAHAYKAADEWWGDVRLVTYAVPAAPPTEMRTHLDARLGEHIILHGYTLLAERLAPGDILQVTLFWEGTAPIEQRYKVFLHLLNGEGELVAQRDSEPGGGLALTTTWTPGEMLPDNHGILIPLDTPPGTYQLLAGLYLLTDPEARLPVSFDGEPAGEVLPLAPITVTAG
jgi:mannosyltransferase